MCWFMRVCSPASPSPSPPPSPPSLVASLGRLLRWSVARAAELTGVSWLLGLGGLALAEAGTDAASTKRKLGDIDEDEDEVIEEESKRWRGDGLYVSIQDFVTKMWGATDDNANVTMVQEKVEEVGAAGDDAFWKQQPQLDFGAGKVQVQFGESTPSRTIQDLNQNTRPAVTVEDAEEQEEALMSFSEKQVYFAEQIRVEEAAAARVSPRASPVPGSRAAAL